MDESKKEDSSIDCHPSEKTYLRTKGSAILNDKCTDSRSQLFVLEKDGGTNKFSG